MLATILLVILFLAPLSLASRWSHTRNWGYYPSSGLGLVVLALVILVLIGRT